MSDAIVASIARQSGLLRELSVVANNIANASTTGFKRDAAVFAEFVSRRAGEPSMSIGSLRGHVLDAAQGGMTRTDGKLDLAIEGDGYFAIGQGDEVLLSRAGKFTLDAQRVLVQADGFPVLDEAGGEITVPEEASVIAISQRGVMSADGFEIATIGILQAEPGSLSRLGGSLYRATGAVRFVDEPSVRQGFLEGSNVSPVIEMARLIEAQRLYEAGAALQTDEHERITQMIEALGRS
ncbi:flagellar hook-basal body complex protein [Parvularcula sp. ZS-1/3]|uniref:Flagellar hook-basal body complex protein n=1 Tax=Parvularcula mediterranea TaxID=2732508 RepID=A0A7Y3W4E5_9PROT|nr:flagellar hook-basal body complex protein [Parvularcula mediterranea]NNU15383.1 flagellar hook-basal body complex protein [Parvularcula mediterranea]